MRTAATLALLGCTYRLGESSEKEARNRANFCPPCPPPARSSSSWPAWSCFLGFGWFGLVSLREREPRAARVAFLLAAACAPSGFAAAGLPPAGRLAALSVLGLCGAAALVAGLVPLGNSRAGQRQAAAPRGRARHHVRARAAPAGQPGVRELLRACARSTGRATTARGPFPACSPREPRRPSRSPSPRPGRSFALTEALRARRGRPGGASARRDRRAGRGHGHRQAAGSLLRRPSTSGVTELRPYHVYTHVGRGSGAWGEPIELDHRWAIAFTVEMDHAAMRHAPEAPVVAESARQYVESARIAVQLAAVIRALGYPARAHIDGNYRVIAPLVARDAGLGEIGRMGLLMTPRLGPRVRLGVVTTDLPLDARPAGRRPLGDRLLPRLQEVRGVLPQPARFRSATASRSTAGCAGGSTPIPASATGTRSAPTAGAA